MTSKTAPAVRPSREELEAQAAELNAQLDAFRDEDNRQFEAERQQIIEAQRQWDEDFVKNYSYAQTEVQVGEARRALDEALAADPVVLAFAGYVAAMRRRYQLRVEQNNALARLGRPEELRVGGMQTELIGLEDYIFQAADRIGTEQVSAEMAALLAERDAAGAGDAP